MLLKVIQYEVYFGLKSFPALRNEYVMTIVCHVIMLSVIIIRSYIIVNSCCSSKLNKDGCVRHMGLVVSCALKSEAAEGEHGIKDNQSCVNPANFAAIYYLKIQELTFG